MLTLWCRLESTAWVGQWEAASYCYRLHCQTPLRRVCLQSTAVGGHARDAPEVPPPYLLGSCPRLCSQRSMLQGTCLDDRGPTTTVRQSDRKSTRLNSSHF